MSIVFDILHLAVAALLAVIGVGYERDEDCPPVRLHPAAQVEMVETDAQPAAHDAALIEASECESSSAALRFPAL